jgi:DNA repair exonuclease SbcCD ATPase subunit
MPLQIERIQAVNFLSHADSTLDLTGRRKLLVDGTSGSGKTSITIDAVRFALYGESRCPARNMLRTGTRGGHVQLILKDGADTFYVKRSISEKGSSTLEVNLVRDGKAVGIPATTMAEKQAWIEKNVTGCSYPLFANSAVWVQGNADSFMSMTPAQRKDLILELAGATEIDGMLDRAKSKASAGNLGLARLEGELTGHRNALSLASAKVVNLPEPGNEEAARSEIAGLEGELKSCDESVKFAEFECEKFRSEHDLALSNSQWRSRLEAEIASLSSLAGEKAVQEKVVSDFRERISSLTQDVSSLEALEAQKVNWDAWKSAQSNLAFEVKNLGVRVEQRRKSMLSMASEYDSQKAKKVGFCSAINAECAVAAKVRDEAAAETLKRIEAEQELYAADVISLEERMKLIGAGEPVFDEQSLIRFRESKTELYLHDSRLKDAEGRLARIDEAAKLVELKKVELLAIPSKDVASSSAALSGANDRMSQLTRHRYDVMSRLSVAKRTLEDCEASRRNKLAAVAEETAAAKLMGEAEESVRKAKDDQNALEALKTALGPSGIKSMAVDKIIPFLESDTNAVLSELSDLRVAMSTKRDSADGEKKVEGLFVTVRKPDGSVLSVDALSGGEQNRLAVAISEAMKRRVRCDFRILDESFQGLDREASENFSEMLAMHQQRIGQVIVISHLPEIKAKMGDVVTVTKGADGISVIN